MLQVFYQIVISARLTDSASIFTEVWPVIRAPELIRDFTASKLIIFTDSHEARTSVVNKTVVGCLTKAAPGVSNRRTLLLGIRLCVPHSEFTSHISCYLYKSLYEKSNCKCILHSSVYSIYTYAFLMFYIFSSQSSYTTHGLPLADIFFRAGVSLNINSLVHFVY